MGGLEGGLNSAGSSPGPASEGNSSSNTGLIEGEGSGVRYGKSSSSGGFESPILFFLTSTFYFRFASRKGRRKKMGVRRRELTFDIRLYAKALYKKRERASQQLLNSLRHTVQTNPSVDRAVAAIESMNTKNMHLQTQAVKGHAILDDILVTLERMDLRYPRSITQVDGTHFCLASLAWHFFGDSIYQEMLTIMRRLGVTELSLWYFAEWARREGKTMEMCIVTSTVMYVVDEETFLVYSNGGRASKSFHSRVMEMLLYLSKGDHSRFKEWNSETIRFAGLHKGDRPACLKSFPSNPDVCTLLFPPPPPLHTHTLMKLWRNKVCLCTHTSGGIK